MSFELVEPSETTTAVIVASPHSGREYPDDIRHASILDDHTLRSSEDAFVDRLVADAPALGAPLLMARMARAYVDLNRSEDELDPALIAGVGRRAHNPRVASGLGVIPRVVANGRPIYPGQMPLAEAQVRLTTHWHPYHAALRRLIRDAQAGFGSAILLDCHSMPHGALESAAGRDGRTPDVVLGDRFGAAAAPEIVATIEAAFQREGLTVARNVPFAGAYTSHRYGRPACDAHVVQIEVDRSIYMDERTLQPSPNFDAVRQVMAHVLSDVADLGRPGMPLAAE